MAGEHSGGADHRTAVAHPDVVVMHLAMTALLFLPFLYFAHALGQDLAGAPAAAAWARSRARRRTRAPAGRPMHEEYRKRYGPRPD